MTRCLVTGLGGFIGSHLLEHLLINTDWEIVGIDSFRHKGITDRITNSIHYQAYKDRVTIITHDLMAPISPIMIDDAGQIDYIINMASNSHVDRSILDPVPFAHNNVMLALNMLEYARIMKPRVYIQVETDEIYGPMFNEIPHSEWDPIIPSNVYSASKACQEALSISYWRTYGVPLVLTPCMNNFGERQDPEKFLPMVIKKVLARETVQIHGKPNDIGSRYWLHARNHADALLWLLQHKTPALFPNADRPDKFNIVGERRIDNLAMAQLIAKILNKPLQYELVDFHTTRPGHDPHYGLDGSKLKAAGWQPPISFDESLERTIRWFRDNPRWLKL